MPHRHLSFLSFQRITELLYTRPDGTYPQYSFLDRNDIEGGLKAFPHLRLRPTALYELSIFTRQGSRSMLTLLRTSSQYYVDRLSDHGRSMLLSRPAWSIVNSRDLTVYYTRQRPLLTLKGSHPPRIVDGHSLTLPAAHVARVSQAHPLRTCTAPFHHGIF